MVRQLTNHILQLKTDVVENRDIKDRCIGRKKLQLDFFGTFLEHFTMIFFTVYLEM